MRFKPIKSNQCSCARRGFNAPHLEAAGRRASETRQICGPKPERCGSIIHEIEMIWAVWLEHLDAIFPYTLGNSNHPVIDEVHHFFRTGFFPWPTNQPG